jgi:hypothetical protein
VIRLGEAPIVSSKRRVKAMFKCPSEFKSKFNNARCLLTISVGQKVHEYEEFLATINLVNSSFKQCIILIDDTLQRHSMRILDDSSENTIYQQSLIAGDAWLLRNKSIYNLLTIPFSIIRWDQWLNHPDYAQARRQIDLLYENDCAYKECLNKTIEIFLTRFQKRIDLHQDIFNYHRAFKLSLEYLKEECTAICLWPELGCHFEVYPSQRNLAMTETHKRFIIPSYPNLLHAVAIKFINSKQLLPQQFSAFG